MTEDEMMNWLSKHWQLGEVPYQAYSEANIAYLGGRFDYVRAVYELYAPLSDGQKARLFQYQAQQLSAEKERLKAKNAAYREIVDALAHEDRYQAETGEGSMAYLARLIQRARALLGTENEGEEGT
jgi:hypothetical protein